MLRIVRGTGVDITGHNYENSPDLNIVGYEYVTATDMDGNPFELTDEEQEQLCIEASLAYEDEPMYFEGDGWDYD